MSETTTNDGGPAFPELDVEKVGDCTIGKSRGGMSLRAHIAIEAMKVIMDSDRYQHEIQQACVGKVVAPDTQQRMNATIAVLHADALIAALGIKP